jgi:2-dehydro-3-deoxyphosphogluconate aldolase/(4S)-4-hydroxy-2-oxoglutarate aldolase
MNRKFLTDSRVLPVVTVRDVNSVVELARSLAAGGMKAIEVTLRTAEALDGIRAIKSEVPDMTIAAGTVTNPVELQSAIDAGADFHLSPGMTPNLLQAAREAQVYLVPGVATASEVMTGMEYGLDTFKLFPAVPLGGIDVLKSLGGPFPQIMFCPTGGLNPGNYLDFLALDNVLCCGGSWMVSDTLVAGEQWAKIEQLARSAMTV